MSKIKEPPVIGGIRFGMDFEGDIPCLRIDIIISSPNKPLITPIKLSKVLIDTGSDYTLIPVEIIKKLKLEPTEGEFEIFGFDDSSTLVKFYEGKVKIEGIIETELLMGGIETGEPLIGMDLLCYLHLLKNSPKGSFEIVSKENYIHPPKKK